MIAPCSARPKHVSYTQDSCRKCCAAEGLPGPANMRHAGSFDFRSLKPQPIRAFCDKGEQWKLRDQ